MNVGNQRTSATQVLTRVRNAKPKLFCKGLKDGHIVTREDFTRKDVASFEANKAACAANGLAFASSDHPATHMWM